MDVNPLENHHRLTVFERIKNIAKRLDISGERHPHTYALVPVVECRGEGLDTRQPGPGIADDRLDPVLYGGGRDAIAAQRKQDLLEGTVAFEFLDRLTQTGFALGDALVFVERNAILRDVGESQFEAWALDPDVQERLRGARFTVPREIAQGQGSLGIDIVVAPSAHIESGGTVRLLLSIGEVGSPSLATAAVEIKFGSETDVGVFVLSSREISAEVIPGRQYFLTVARLADAPADTYPADVWLVGASLKYRPPGIQEVEGTSFLVYEVRP